MNIGLGTVQLGLPYGNKSKSDLMPESEAFAILSFAVERGIDFYDTAIAYGESESRIGIFELHRKYPSAIISSKIPSVPRDVWSNYQKYLDFLVRNVEQSLARLKMPRYRLLQLHQCDVEFLNSGHVIRALKQLVEQGFAEQLGLSVYTPDQAEAAIDTGIFSKLQVPANLLDTRFLQPDFLLGCKQHGIDLIVRSAFLQGVLVQDVALPPVKKVHLLASLKKMTIDSISKAGVVGSLQSLSLRFLSVNHGHNIWKLLIGADSVASLRENMEILDRFKEPLPDNVLELLAPARQYAESHSLLNPGLWNA